MSSFFYSETLGMYTTKECEDQTAAIELTKKRRREDEAHDENCTQPCGLTPAGHRMVRGREEKLDLSKWGFNHFSAERDAHAIAVREKEKLQREYLDRIFSEKPPAKPWTTGYLDFYRELSDRDDPKQCLVYVYEIKGKPYVTIGNSAFFSPYKRLRKQSDIKYEACNVHLNLGSWAELCSVVTHTYVACAIGMCTKRDADNVTKCVTASYNKQTGAYERDIYGNRNIAVKLIDEVVYVIIQEMVWDTKQMKYQSVKDVCLKTSEWKKLAQCMSGVNAFLSQWMLKD
jgi:hypothetical protein